MKYLLVGLLATGVLFSGCDSKEAVTSISGTIVKGKIADITGNEKILLQELRARSVNTIDTIIPDMEGNFVIGPNVPSYGFYRVFINNKNFVNLILSPKDTLVLNAQVDDLEGTYSIDGSQETALLKEFNDLMNAYVDEIDSINQILQTAQMQQNVERYQQAYQAQMMLNNSTGTKVREFVSQNSNMLASLSAVQKLDPEQDYDLFVSVAEGIRPKLEGKPLFEDFVSRIEMIKRVQPGAKLDDLTLPNVQGGQISIYEAKGKVTLIDFWASWCKPCRAENPNVVAAYNKFKSRGFQIIGVSLDQDGEQWAQAIKADGLNWPQMSDLKAWQSAACQKYNISSIPANFLIDEDGIILAKGLRGEALHQKLEEVLGS